MKEKKRGEGNGISKSEFIHVMLKRQLQLA